MRRLYIFGEAVPCVPHDPDALYFYAVYDRPRDHPGEWVIRRWIVKGDDVHPERDLFARAASLEGARAQLPEGLVRLPRNPKDDPAIVEVWL